jgi:leader peptidase (prepilin peptidase) / N-methyltransferase
MHTDLIIYTLLGLVIGSFLNVCIYRIPLGKSVVFPGSSCPHCGKPVRPYDNIPVVSYILLGGKCRDCRGSISIQYPIVELIAGGAFLACGWKWAFSSPTFVNTLLLCIVILLVFTDYHHQILPNVLTLPGLIAGILLSPFQWRLFFLHDLVSPGIAAWLWPGNPEAVLPLIGSVIGALAGGVPLLLLAITYEKLRKRQGLGMGDVKMMAMIGAFLGWPIAVLTIFAGSFLGTIVGVFLILFRNKDLQTKLPLGVFLGIGSAIFLFYGIPFVQWYLRIPR